MPDRNATSAKGRIENPKSETRNPSGEEALSLGLWIFLYGLVLPMNIDAAGPRYLIKKVQVSCSNESSYKKMDRVTVAFKKDFITQTQSYEALSKGNSYRPFGS